jgi:hypothetical protein
VNEAGRSRRCTDDARPHYGRGEPAWVRCFAGRDRTELARLRRSSPTADALTRSSQCAQHRESSRFWRTIKTPAEIELSQAHQPSAFETATCECIVRAKAHGHPERPDQTIWGVQARAVQAQAGCVRRRRQGDGQNPRRRADRWICLQWRQPASRHCRRGSIRPTSSSTCSRVSAIRGHRRQSRHPTLGHTPVADCASYDRTEVLDLMSGVLEDIIGALSRIRRLFVIAHIQLHLQRSCGRCEAGRA